MLEDEMKVMLAEAQDNPILFVNNFLYTFNPSLTPANIRFKLFPFQEKLHLEVKTAIEGGYDIFIEKSREIGATYTILALFLWFWRYIPGSNFLLGSRKETYVDNRGETGEGELTNKEESLFGKLDYMIRKMPHALKPLGFNETKHFTYMSLKNPQNGNVISGESSNPNFSRGGRFKAILLDEFGFWENDQEAWSATADTTKCRIVLTTPGIKPNTKAERLRFGRENEKIKVLSFHASLDPRKDEAYFAREKARRSEEDYAREIDLNWERAVKGRVYDEIRHAIVGDFPYNPFWPLLVCWDFGLDGTSIGWWQINLTNAKPRLVDSFHYSDEPIQYFMPFFNHPIELDYSYDTKTLDLIDRVKKYKKAVHFGDPDVEKRAYQNKGKQSTRQILRDYGIIVQTNTASNQFHLRRNATKVLLAKGIEVNDTLQNKHFMIAIKASVYPPRDEWSTATSAIIKPVHNWTSHPRTMLEYLAVNYDATEVYQPKPAPRAVENQGKVDFDPYPQSSVVGNSVEFDPYAR